MKEDLLTGRDETACAILTYACKKYSRIHHNGRGIILNKYSAKIAQEIYKKKRKKKR